jgi:hypothetical protein
MTLGQKPSRSVYQFFLKGIVDSPASAALNPVEDLPG